MRISYASLKQAVEIIIYTTAEINGFYKFNGWNHLQFSQTLSNCITELHAKCNIAIQNKWQPIATCKVFGILNFVLIEYKALHSIYFIDLHKKHSMTTTFFKMFSMKRSYKQSQCMH